MSGVTFHPFPKPTQDLERCKLWIKQCGRPHRDLAVDKIQRHHYVCSKHFPEGAVDPLSAMYEKFSTPTPRRKRVRDREQGTPIIPKRKYVDNVEVDSATSSSISVISEENVPQFDDIFSEKDIGNQETNEETNLNSVCDKYVQTENHLFNSKSFVKRVTKSDKECFYYVGIPTLQLLLFLFDWILPAAKKIKLWDGRRRGVSGRKGGKIRTKLFEEMILTLVKIRRGYGNKHLSYLFNICSISVQYI